MIKSQLNSLLSESQTERLSVCAPLASCLVSAINNRFSDMLSNTDAQLAAVVSPKFKFD